MKKIIAITTSILVTSAMTFAQVTDAVLYHKDGQLDKAKEAIDEATSNEKQSTKTKTWFYSGAIYKDLAKAQPEPQKKYEYFTTSVNAFQKAIDLDNSEQFVGQSKDSRKEIYGLIFNEGVGFHNSNDFANAMKFDELAADVQIDDVSSRVNALINASIAAAQLNNMDKGIALNKKILELNPNDKETYLELILLHDKKGDDAAAMKYAETASAKFPEDKRFTNEVARLAIKSGNADEAIAKLKVASDKEPTNTLYLNKIAELYSELDKPKDAETYYKKALAVDPNNVDANYNLGSFYFNQAADYIKQMNDLDLNADPRKSADLRSKAMDNFNNCLPYYEKVYPQLSPEEKEKLKPSMEAAYIRLKKEDKIKDL